MNHRGKLILLPPNRVWRTYPGGRTLDALASAAAPADTHFAEDWIASTTRASNAGREQVAEGVSSVRIGHDPQPRDFATLLASDADYFLGAAHVRAFGAQPQLLVKFLDSGTRLHFQVHPTREFARRVLGAPSGKTEAYYVLGVRDSADGEHAPTNSASTAAPDETGYIYVGFQRPPTLAELKREILAQDIAALEARFDRIRVRPGDTFIIPGGTPHALGPGVFMVEIQEPSDLVVRFEFERAGYVLPEAARYMSRDLDFALTVFDLSPLPPADLERRVRCQPRRLRELGPGSYEEELIGPNQTDCFRVTRMRIAAETTLTLPGSAIVIVTSGAITASAGGETHRLDTYQKVFVPAGLGAFRVMPDSSLAELLVCFPPAG